MAEIKDRIMSLRLEKCMTQSQLADALKVSASAIGMCEQGRRKPSYDLLKKIADYFHVDTDYLLGVADVKNKIVSMIAEEKAEYNLTPSELAEFEKLKNMQTSLFLFNDKQLSADAMEKFEQALLEAFIDTIKQRKGDTNK